MMKKIILALCFSALMLSCSTENLVNALGATGIVKTCKTTVSGNVTKDFSGIYTTKDVSTTSSRSFICKEASTSTFPVLTITLSGGVFTAGTYDLSDTSKSALTYSTSTTETYTAGSSSTDCSLTLTDETNGTYKCTDLVLGTDSTKKITLASGTLVSK